MLLWNIIFVWRIIFLSLAVTKFIYIHMSQYHYTQYHFLQNIFSSNYKKHRLRFYIASCIDSTITWEVMQSFNFIISVGILAYFVIVILLLTHWGRMTHICVNKLIIIGSDNGLSPSRRQAIIGTNARILLIGPLGTNFSEIFIEIYTFSFKEINLKISSEKWRPSCLDLDVSINTRNAHRKLLVQHSQHLKCIAKLA